MDDVLQDLQAESLKKEIEKLRQTVGRSAGDDSDATSDDEGALHVDSDDSRDDPHPDRGTTRLDEILKFASNVKLVRECRIGEDVSVL